MQQYQNCETRLLKVSINRPHQIMARVAFLFAVVVSLYYYFKNDIASAKVVVLCMGTIAVLLYVVSWSYVLASSSEITTRNVFQTSTVEWNRINRIVSIPWLSMIVLHSDDDRVDLIPAYWSGNDKDEMLRLLASKIEQSGIQPYEQQGFR